MRWEREIEEEEEKEKNIHAGLDKIAVRYGIKPPLLLRLCSIFFLKIHPHYQTSK
jgi:hypothetical protein